MALRVRVCGLTEVVRGELRAFAVPGVTWPVIVTEVDGALVAVPGVCPHEDVALWDGELRGDAIVCPGHAYAFRLEKHPKGEILLRLRIDGKDKATTGLEPGWYVVETVDGDKLAGS